MLAVAGWMRIKILATRYVVRKTTTGKDNAAARDNLHRAAALFDDRTGNSAITDE